MAFFTILNLVKKSKSFHTAGVWTRRGKITEVEFMRETRETPDLLIAKPK